MNPGNYFINQSTKRFRQIHWTLLDQSRTSSIPPLAAPVPGASDDSTQFSHPVLRDPRPRWGRRRISLLPS